jgi:hypothetical protein
VKRFLWYIGAISVIYIVMVGLLKGIASIT